MCCKNPLLAEERSRKRESLLEASEAELGKIATAVTRERRPLRGADKIALRLGRVVNRYKMAKHFEVEVTEDTFSFSRKESQIAAEAVLDGIYVLRTSLSDEALSTDGVVSSYQSLAGVERAFRAFNTDLDIRPIRHRSEERVRAHVFLRMLSYSVTFHMERALAPMLFRDDDKAAAEAAGTSPVAPAQRSASAVAKVTTKRTAERLPVHSFGPSSPTSARSAPTGSTDRRRSRGLHHRHHTDTDPAPGTRSPRRLAPTRLRVVRTCRIEHENAQVIGVSAAPTEGTSD